MRRNLLVMALAVMWLSGNVGVFGDQGTAMINVDGRQQTSLNGAWQIIVDPYEMGYYNYRYQVDQNGYFKNYKPRNKSSLVEYDFDAGSRLQVPGDWNTQRDDLFFYEGTVWYKRDFDCKISGRCPRYRITGTARALSPTTAKESRPSMSCRITTAK